MSTAHLIAHPLRRPRHAHHMRRGPSTLSSSSISCARVFRAGRYGACFTSSIRRRRATGGPPYPRWSRTRRRLPSVSTRRRRRRLPPPYRIPVPAGGYVQRQHGRGLAVNVPYDLPQPGPAARAQVAGTRVRPDDNPPFLSLQALATTAVSQATRSTRAATLAMRSARQPPAARRDCVALQSQAPGFARPLPSSTPRLRRAKPPGRRVLRSPAAAVGRGRGGPRQARKKEGRGGAAAIRTWCRSMTLPPRRMPGPSGSARTGTGRRSAARRPRWPPAGSCRSPRSTCPTPC